MKTCFWCHHVPSCRFDHAGMKCYCQCHDIADLAPVLLTACQELITYAETTSNCNVCGGAHDDHKADCPVPAAYLAVKKAKGV